MIKNNIKKVNEKIIMSTREYKIQYCHIRVYENC